MANNPPVQQNKNQGYAQRLLSSRMRVLCDHGFFGLLLMHLRFGLSKTAPTAYTNGKSIVFGEQFLNSLNDKELDFVLMHEVMHVVLQHCFRGKDYDGYKFNIACDIVVNSNILKENNMDLSSITLLDYGESMHLAPDGKEGYLYTAEEVYQMLNINPKFTVNSQGDKINADAPPCEGDGDGNGSSQSTNANANASWDDHSHWEDEMDSDEFIEELWISRFEDAAEAISIKESVMGRGLMPAFAKRILEELNQPQADWRTILAEFIQEIVVDYSLSPPDKRYDDSGFYLPDFNGTEIEVKDLLFMVDTSGSMSDKAVSECYSEVKGALDIFDGKLCGWLGFFDGAIIEPKEFDSIESLKNIRPAGGGGTDFGIIFKYVEKHMSEKLPCCIIILTDGYAPFPDESKALGIPVMWVITNDEITPPWGKTVRIKTND